MKIAILGGTGKEGRGLAFRWAKAGHQIFIGSRSLEKAKVAANEIDVLVGKKGAVEGTTLVYSIEQAETCVLTVPFIAHREFLEGYKKNLSGKLLVDISVPLVPPTVNKVQMPPAGSAALEAQQILGPAEMISSAFQNISYEILLSDKQADCDVLVTGNSPEARAKAMLLVKDAGFVGWDAGPLENSMVAEGLTSILININKKYHVTHAGIKITGVS